MKKLLLIFSLAGSILAARGQQGAGLITVTDMAKIKQPKGTAISHNGRQVVFTVTSIVPDEANKNDYAYRNQLWIVPADGSAEARPLTAIALSSGQPAWSPNDEQIAFTRVTKGRTQIFLLSLSGGEPVQVTDNAHGASYPQWSPDGKKILYSTGLSYSEMLKDSLMNPSHAVPAWTLEKPGFKSNPAVSKTKANATGNLDEVRAYLAQDEAEPRVVKVFNKLNFEGEASTEPEYDFNHYFICDAKANARSVALTHGFRNFSGAVFTPDSKNIILSSRADTLVNPDRLSHNNIYTIPVTGGALTALIADNEHSLTNGPVSPSGRYLVYESNLKIEQGKPVPIQINQLNIYDKQNPGKKINIPVDRVVAQEVWSPDSKYLYFTAQSNGGIPIYCVNMATMKLERLATFDEGISGLDVGKNRLVYVKTEVANPFEVYTADLGNKNQKRLTSFNYEWLKDKKLSFPEKKYYTNNKGEKVEYWVMKPTNFDPNKKYPVMLQIHGGPTAMWGPGENTMWHEYQFFCAQGYGVVYSNPRGSGGYGIDFTKANYQDWGAGPTEDVLAALDGALAEGWGDPARTVATGGSYAGYLTAWLAGHTKRFAAISSQRGVYDLTTFFGEGNAWTLVPMYFGGYPWEEKIRPILARESPFTYVDQITTPYLMLHGETDLRTGIVQGEMMYKALKVLNRPVEYVQHPGGTHELVRSGNVRQRIDQMLRIYEFFERYITH